MKAVDSHLLTLLKASSQFIVPIYQRLYSWQEPECAQLWADILRAGSSAKLGAHFTGSIVYVARDQATNTSAEPDLIIDGQQRVTTVTLILAALAARLEELPADEQEPWDGFSPKKIRNRYLLNDDEEGERQFKLILSQSDKAALISLLQGVAPSGGMVDPRHRQLRLLPAEARRPDGRPWRRCARGSTSSWSSTSSSNEGRRQPAARLRGDELDRQEAVPGRPHPELRPDGPAAEGAGEGLHGVLAPDGAGVRRRRGEPVRRVRPSLPDDQDRRDPPTRRHLRGLQGPRGRAAATPARRSTSLVIELRQYARRYCAMALGKENDPKLARSLQGPGPDQGRRRLPVPARGLHRLRARHARSRRASRDRADGDVVHVPSGGVPRPDQLAQQDVRRVRRRRPQGPLRRERQGALPRH